MLYKATRTLALILGLAMITPMIACGPDIDDSGGSSSNNDNNNDGNNGSTNNGSTNNGSTNNGSTNNGSTNNGASPPVSVSRDTALSDLTEADRTEVCQSIADYTATLFTNEEFLDVQCTLIAVIFSSFSEDAPPCDTLRTSCLQDPSQYELSTSPSDIDISECVEEFATDCVATLGQIIDCQAEQIRALKAVSGGLSCSSDLSALQPDLGPKCQAVEDICPGFINDDGE